MSIETVVVYGCEGGRFDQVMSIVNSLHNFTSKSRRIIAVSELNCFELLLPGYHSLICNKELMPVGTVCGIIPFVGAALVRSTSGLCWNLENQTLQFGQLISTSNRTAKREVVIHTEHPLLWTSSLHFSSKAMVQHNEQLDEKTQQASLEHDFVGDSAALSANSSCKSPGSKSG
jgi:thiamine pyrophosphokinase